MQILEVVNCAHLAPVPSPLRLVTLTMSRRACLRLAHLHVCVWSLEGSLLALPIVNLSLSMELQDGMLLDLWGFQLSFCSLAGIL